MDDARKTEEQLICELEQLRDRVLTLEQENLSTKQTLEFERGQLLSIFNSIDEVIYVSDFETYELLYGNQSMRNSFGDVVGRKCYKAFQDRDEPCEFCTNDKIRGEHEGKAYIWEFQNLITRRWYRCIDKAIKWPDGRMVRYEMAIDVTESRMRKQEELVLKRLEALDQSVATLKEMDHGVVE